MKCCIKVYIRNQNKSIVQCKNYTVSLKVPFVINSTKVYNYRDYFNYKDSKDQQSQRQRSSRRDRCFRVLRNSCTSTENYVKT